MAAWRGGEGSKGRSPRIAAADDPAARPAGSSRLARSLCRHVAEAPEDGSVRRLQCARYVRAAKNTTPTPPPPQKKPRKSPLCGAFAGTIHPGLAAAAAPALGGWVVVGPGRAAADTAITVSGLRGAGKRAEALRPSAPSGGREGGRKGGIISCLTGGKVSNG